MEFLKVPYSVSRTDSGWQWCVNFTGCAPDRSIAIAEATHTIKKAATRYLTESYSELQRLRMLVNQAELLRGISVAKRPTRAHRPNRIAD